MYTILLIEDDIELGSIVEKSLKRYGFAVLQPESFRLIEEEFSEIKPDLVLMDINLPYYDGFHLCRSIRRHSKIPIIMISARSQEVDQILALELGADDYLVKPFTPEMLLSKVNAAIRRVYGEYAGSEQESVLPNGLSLNTEALTLWRGGKTVDLSKNEYRLLKKLLDHHGGYVAREVLIEEVWDSTTFIDDNTLTVNIARIRQKLSMLSLEDAIKSKRGAGYMFDAESGENGDD